MKLRIYLCILALVVADLTAWAVGFVITTPVEQMSINIALMGLWTFWVLFNNRNYLKRKSFWAELQGLVAGSITFFIFSVIAASLYGQSHAFYYYLQLSACLVFLLPLFRALVRRMLAYLGLWDLPTVVFGEGENAKQAILALSAERALGYKVIAQFRINSLDDQENSIPLKEWPVADEEFLWLQDKHCVIALEANQSEARDNLIRLLSEHQVDQISVIPAMRGVPLFGLDTTQFFSHEVLMINLKIQLRKSYLRFFKRTFDFFGSSLLLFLFSPAFAYIAWQVTKDGGPAFFGHERIGRNGRAFKCYKFRSMVLNSQEVLKELLAADLQAKAEWEKDFKLKNDPRITTIGHFLRRTSLDELPQLLNVFKGEMSLVGPRPVVQAELERYGRDVIYYFMTNPGMTGLWQISGRNDVDYATRVYFDAWYVKNWSLWTDIAILFKTISVVTARKGAY